MATDMEGFGDLLAQAETLTADMDQGCELPPVERNLQQILEAGQRLLSRAPAAPDNTDVQASILLGSKGYVLPRIQDKLEGLRAGATFEPLEPVRDTDIQGFLKNERENALLAVIEQTRKNTLEGVERQHWEGLEDEWERQKQKILTSLLGQGTEGFTFSQEPELGAEPEPRGGRSSLDHMEMAYARQVFVYNEHVIENDILPSLVDMFLEVAHKAQDKQVLDLWQLVKALAEIPAGSSGNPAANRRSPATQAAIVARGRAHLEANYVRYLEDVVSGNLRTAQLGGVPGTYRLVLSYLNVRPPHPHARAAEDGELDGQPVWALVFYCLRCGDLKAVKHIMERAGQQLGDFPTFMSEFAASPDRRLGPGSDTKLKLQYRRLVKNCPDPYKRAVYCVVGRCDWGEDHGEILDKIDDYLWLKLSHCQDAGGDAQDTLTLQQLQKILYEDYGEAHFSGYQQPFLYFLVLFVTGQFEAAVDFLSGLERLRPHGVHVALALQQAGLLVAPPSTQAPLLSAEPGEGGLRRLNLARLVMMYTRKFESTDPREALQYFYFLRHLKTAGGDNFFMSCVSELVLETREFDMLLGRLESDGTRKPGAIDKFGQDSQRITELVAQDTQAKGMFEDAVRLYDLAKNQEKALTIMNQLLSQVVGQAGTPASPRHRLATLAVAMAERYQKSGHQATPITTRTFFLLLDLVTFFDFCHAGNVNKALEVIQGIKLLPFNTDEVEHRLNSFKNYSNEIKRCLPDILLSTMNILLSKYNSLKSAGAGSPMRPVGLAGANNSHLSYLRDQAKTLIMFAGMLPYRLPGDANQRLVQAELLMS